jgi:RNA-directed DNA polymerase
VKLLNLLRQNVKDERVIQMIKRYLKSGVMENGVVFPTEEDPPQGGNLSPLLAKSERASQRLLESIVRYLEGTLQLKVNREKSKTVSVFAIRNFKFFGFCFGKGRNGVFIRVHQKSWKKFKALTSRSRCGSIVNAMKRITVVARGWLGYYGLADMKKNIGTFSGVVNRALTKERLIHWGFFDLATAYQSVHVNC